MDAIMITCEVCGQQSYVLKARYKYRADTPNGHPAEEHVLLEVERDIDCPTCGTRTQSEREHQRQAE
jgi:hypothetical protein